MPDRDLQIEASQRRDKGRARIAMHEYHVRLLLFQYLTDALKNIHRHIKEACEGSLYGLGKINIKGLRINRSPLHFI